MADETSPYERLLDLVVHAPLGFALYTRDTAPGFVRLFVARGRAEVDRHRRRVDGTVGQARTVGQFALTYGAPEVKRRVGDGVDRARSVAGDVVTGIMATEVPRRGSAPDAPGSPSSSSSSPGATSATAPASEAPTPEEPAPEQRATAPVTESSVDPGAALALAIPDYDELSASQVVEHLEGLTPDELAAIETYELARRGRRTILGKIELLRG